VLGVGSALAVVGLVAVTLNVAGRDEPVGVSTGPSSQSPLANPEPGDAAVWTTDPDALPSSSASTFTALVSRLGCNSGVTGEVMRPGVVLSDTEVVITFTVEAADPRAGDCQGNDAVPYVVDLGQVIGDRALVDGRCRPKGAAVGTSFCEGGDVRWRRQSTAVAVRGIDVETSPEGAQRIQILFDGPLPDDRVTYIEDVTTADIQSVAYTTQDPTGAHVCGDVHYFGAADTGSIDVLIPSGWFDPSIPVRQVAARYGPPDFESVDHPGKIVACGPYKGYVQYSIWAPASDDPGDVKVSVSEDATRIIIDVQPASIDPANPPRGSGRVRLQARDWARSVETGEESVASGTSYTVLGDEGRVLESGNLGVFGEAIITQLAGEWTIKVDSLENGTKCGFERRIMVREGEQLVTLLDCG